MVISGDDSYLVTGRTRGFQEHITQDLLWLPTNSRASFWLLARVGLAGPTGILNYPLLGSRLKGPTVPCHSRGYKSLLWGWAHLPSLQIPPPKSCRLARTWGTFQGSTRGGMRSQSLSLALQGPIEYRIDQRPWDNE